MARLIEEVTWLFRQSGLRDKKQILLLLKQSNMKEVNVAFSVPKLLLRGQILNTTFRLL